MLIVSTTIQTQRDHSTEEFSTEFCFKLSAQGAASAVTSLSVDIDLGMDLPNLFIFNHNEIMQVDSDQAIKERNLSAAMGSKYIRWKGSEAEVYLDIYHWYYFYFNWIIK